MGQTNDEEDHSDPTLTGLQGFRLNAIQIIFFSFTEFPLNLIAQTRLLCLPVAFSLICFLCFIRQCWGHLNALPKECYILHYSISLNLIPSFPNAA